MADQAPEPGKNTLMKRAALVALRRILQLLPLIIAQQMGPQRLNRTPEPKPVTDAPENVLEYNQAMMTRLAILYAVALEVVHRARPEFRGGGGTLWISPVDRATIPCVLASIWGTRR